MPEALPAGMGPTGVSWWGRQSTIKKVAIVGGGVVGTSLLVWGIRRWTQPDPIRDISDGCNDFAFANAAEVEEAIIPILRNVRRVTGNIDPFYVTTKFLKRYAPECRSYPEEARNVGEADLYVQAFVKVVETMEGERMLSPDQRDYFLQMVSVWGEAQGLDPSQLPSPVGPGDAGSPRPGPGTFAPGLQAVPQ